MYINNLLLKNFRSFSQKELIFPKNTSLIIGPNATGKTNLLEAIYLLATGKSFHASKEIEMIREGEELARIEGKINPDLNLEVMITRGNLSAKKIPKKLFKVNGVGKRWHDFVGNLRCVLFRPEDIDIILGTPSLRRYYLNLVLEQVDWQYRACHMAYQKGIRQRNKLLERIREGESQPNQLLFWNQLLIKNGAIITQKREELIDFFNDFLSNKAPFYNEPKKAKLHYDKSIISEERLRQYANEEIAAGVTLVGPQRDDVKFFEDSRDLALYGSRGEQRMTILALKLAEVEFLSSKAGERPILLLDDIFSELDKEHRKQIINIIPYQQTIITTTDLELIDKKIRDKIKVIKL